MSALFWIIGGLTPPVRRWHARTKVDDCHNGEKTAVLAQAQVG